MLERYFSLCERKDNKRSGLAALEAAKENDGILKSTYKAKYGFGRRQSHGPAPAKIDRGSRACAFFGSLMRDGDQVNSAISIIYYLAIVLALDI